MDAALDALRSRFPNQVVIGFEELWDVRPQREPQIDLGPGNSTLEQVVARIRRENPKYRIELNTPELSRYLCEHQMAWHRAHGKGPFGVAGDFLGDCEPAHHRH